MRTTSKTRRGTGSPYGWGNTGSTSYAGSKGPTGYKGKAASGYNNMSWTCSQKIQSWKYIYNQTCGTAKCPRPTPAQLNTLANWVNKGAIVHNVPAAAVNKWANITTRTFNRTSPTSCKNVLAAKFGKTVIKAVCRSKTGSFMVATSPTCKGKPFCFPK